MTHDRSRRDRASKSRHLQAFGNIILSHADEGPSEAPPPDLSLRPEDLFGESGSGANGLPGTPGEGFNLPRTPGAGFDAAWASEAVNLVIGVEPA